MTEQIDIAEFLLIAERVLGLDTEALKSAAKLGSAESALAAPFMGLGDTRFYPDPAQRAAIVCSRIIRNHPLPDGNKRTGYLCMLIQLDRAGLASKRRPRRDRRCSRGTCCRGAFRGEVRGLGRHSDAKLV